MFSVLGFFRLFIFIDDCLWYYYDMFAINSIFWSLSCAGWVVLRCVRVFVLACDICIF